MDAQGEPDDLGADYSEPEPHAPEQPPEHNRPPPLPQVRGVVKGHDGHVFIFSKEEW